MSDIAQEVILTNARVLTMADGPGHSADSLAMRAGRIVAVGSRRDVCEAVSPGAVVSDLGGRTVMPGLVDTHTHLCATASWRRRVDCRDLYNSGIDSIDAILTSMRVAAEGKSPGELIAGTGSAMQEFRIKEGRLPTRRELDDAVPDHPAFIMFGAHITVANSRALRLIDVSTSTPDPPGGVIERDDTGEPTGVLRERAQRPLWMAEQPESLEDLKFGIRQEMLAAAARGVTSIHEILDKPVELRALQELDRDGELPLRVDVIVRVVESGFPKWGLLELGLQHGFGNDRLRMSGIKMSIDGGFTGRQAYWSKNSDDECIGDHAEHCGPCRNHAIVRIQQDELDEVVSAYHNAGMRICVHAIGDRAADMILRSYEMALRGRDTGDVRHRIEHLGNWLMTDSRIKQAKTLGVTPVPNPAFFHFLGAEAVLTLGPQRTEESFPMRRLLDEGFRLTFGADGPLYWPIDPLRDAAATVTRKTRDGLPVSPDQAITPYEALCAVTSSAAWLGYKEDRLGTLEAGKLADIAVLASDPLSSGQLDIGAIRVDATFVAGHAVWESDDLRRSLEMSQRRASQSTTAPIS